ncbi:hypothetical protein [Streptomyces noursei]|uniref:hypothetical protein n=1 Tax=Streptomyces noursei TaxID=1971 RepID=UPI0016760A95|nr:hypothetical protein [Streptomyces noursei]MCZ1013462.1 hypothetical protein [Streptomyces noursei]GGX44818.1 hypothetical protein GCM10010341_78170 [Streptomyces noursei]
MRGAGWRHCPGRLHHVAHEVPGHWDDFPGLYRKLAPRTVRFLVADKLNHDMVASWFIAAEWRSRTATECAALEDVWHA